MSKMKRFVDRARKLAAEIQQIFDDAAHWNQHVRKLGEEPINPDPDGALGRALLSLGRFISDNEPPKPGAHGIELMR